MAHENNTLLRQKMSQESMRTTAPRCSSRSSGRGLNLADAIIDAMDADGSIGLDTSGARTSDLLAAYVEAFERILGARPGSLAP
jgi:hypothetical protein